MRWINDQDITQYTNAHLPFMEAAEYGWFNSLHTKTNHDIVVAIVVAQKNKHKKTYWPHGTARHQLDRPHRGKSRERMKKIVTEILRKQTA